MTVRLARFLKRWSAPEGSVGPLITFTTPGRGFGYIALRLRAGHKVAWLRLIKHHDRHLPRLTLSRPRDLRGQPCPCGSGIRIPGDTDGCEAEGCRDRVMNQGRTA